MNSLSAVKKDIKYTTRAIYVLSFISGAGYKNRTCNLTLAKSCVTTSTNPAENFTSSLRASCDERDEHDEHDVRDEHDVHVHDEHDEHDEHDVQLPVL